MDLTFQVAWGDAMSQLLVNRNLAYLPNTIYVEFENQSDPEVAVTVPSFDGYDGLAYYSSLLDSPDRDFLRLQLGSLPGAIGVVSGYEAYFEAGHGNKVTLQVQTSGAAGVHGKPFSHLNNSKIFGAALVAAPVWGDWTQDLVWMRGYFDADKQAPKRASTQIAVPLQVLFPVD